MHNKAGKPDVRVKSTEEYHGLVVLCLAELGLAAVNDEVLDATGARLSCLPRSWMLDSHHSGISRSMYSCSSLADGVQNRFLSII